MSFTMKQAGDVMDVRGVKSTDFSKTDMVRERGDTPQLPKGTLSVEQEKMFFDQLKADGAIPKTLFHITTLASLNMIICKGVIPASVLSQGSWKLGSGITTNSKFGRVHDCVFLTDHVPYILRAQIGKNRLSVRDFRVVVIDSDHVENLRQYTSLNDFPTPHEYVCDMAPRASIKTTMTLSKCLAEFFDTTIEEVFKGSL